MTRRPYRPRHLVRDSILEAIRRGASRVKCPRGVRDWGRVTHKLAMTFDPYSGYWAPSFITLKAVEEYIRRRAKGDSPLAINDACPVEAMTDAL